MDRGKQIETGLVDFVPHPPSRLDAYTYPEEPMEMTFGRFHFRVGKEGSYRLEIPTFPKFSVEHTESSSSASSVESGDEETSSPRFISTKASEKLAKIFSDMSFESSADSYISSDSESVDSFDFIDKSITVGKVFTNLYDGVTESSKAQNSKYHQIYVIGEASRDQDQTSEAFDDLGNPYVDPSDLRRGLGDKYVGPTPRMRVQLSQAAWDRAARAMDGSEPMATTATVEELQAYQYRLARAGRELEKQTEVLNKRREAASASSRRRADLSRHSGTSGDSHREARNRARLKEDDEVKTAFITPYGVFCYRTMPFGLKNAGATYQRMMQKCLAEQIGKNVQVYIDDVVITSKKGDTLIEDLKETFDNLDKFCLKLNPTKCSFGVPAGELLGFLVSARGIEANPEKIQAIVTMRKPTKLKEVRD
ncbi:hypothetical protein QYE76_009124 [Lolium multiflorum]|uniref:Reverse transcriptase domain-containing protein n=1 Tax=Lolium multiflorum TaxID=4521 RepID=A0AAD8TUL7_LOLMU|nr:hypothetical protein QYE76_009124 [Lolium multiflorum]